MLVYHVSGQLDSENGRIRSTELWQKLKCSILFCERTRRCIDKARISGNLPTFAIYKRIPEHPNVISLACRRNNSPIPKTSIRAILGSVIVLQAVLTISSIPVSVIMSIKNYNYFFNTTVDYRAVMFVTYLKKWSRWISTVIEIELFINRALYFLFLT